MTDTTTTHLGTIKKYNGTFGFIVPDDPAVNGGKDVFVHRSAVQSAGLRLGEGDRVTYTIEMHEPTKRTCAVNLKLV